MTNPDLSIPSDKKQFPCSHCQGTILVPRDLPPTTAPCPYCGGMITSPGDDTQAPAAAAVPAQASPPSGPPPVPPPDVIEALVHGSPAPPSKPAAAKPTQEAPPPPAAKSPASPPPPPASAMRPAAPPPPAPQPKPEPTPVAKVQEPEPASPAPQRDEKRASTKAEVAAKKGGFPVAIVMLVVLVGGALTFFVTKEMNRKIPPPSVRPAGDLAPLDANYIRIGWQKDAARLLKGFLNADKADGKLPYLLNGGSLAPRVREFYGDDIIDDSDTPASSFSVYELSEEDRKRGLFMMTYDQPPQFEMREFFRPLASLEVQYGIDEADILLSTVARAGNFAMEPLRVHAFFKRTSSGLKLDWEIFAQTKYRTFRSFTEMPDPGHTGVFRVFIVEDVPDRGQASQGFRTYRLSDPAHTDDTARVNVRADTELGRTLSVLNWRGTKDGRPLTRTATVELEWTGGKTQPQLQLRRFICWEFLGLGGEDNKPAASAK